MAAGFDCTRTPFYTHLRNPAPANGLRTDHIIASPGLDQMGGHAGLGCWLRVWQSRHRWRGVLCQD